MANFNTAKSTLAGGTPLTVADLQAIPVTFGNLTTPIEEWHADYISSQLGTGDTVSLTDWQNTINSINEGVAARWKIQQVADNATGHEASDVTNHLLARATDGTFDVVTALGAGVSKTAAGFGASSNINGLTSTSTPAQIQSAVLTYIGFTDPIYAAWNGNSDRANFTLADFTACYNNNETQRSGGANACTPTAADWASASSVLTLFAEAKSDVADDQTLSASQLSAIGLDVSRFGATPANWVYEYISESVSATAANISDWQNTINGLNINRIQTNPVQLVSGYSLPSLFRRGTTQTPGSVNLAFEHASEGSVGNVVVDPATSSNCSAGTATLVNVDGENHSEIPFTAADVGNCTINVTASAYGYPDFVQQFSFSILQNAVDQTDAVTIAVSNEGERQINQPITLTPSGGSGTGTFSYAVQSGDCSVSNSGEVTSNTIGNCTIRVTKAGDQSFNPRFADRTVKFHDVLAASPSIADFYLNADSSGNYTNGTGYPVYADGETHRQRGGTTSRFSAWNNQPVELKISYVAPASSCSANTNSISIRYGGYGQAGANAPYCRYRIRYVDANGIPTSDWSPEMSVKEPGMQLIIIQIRQMQPRWYIDDLTRTNAPGKVAEDNHLIYGVIINPAFVDTEGPRTPQQGSGDSYDPTWHWLSYKNIVRDNDGCQLYIVEEYHDYFKGSSVGSTNPVTNKCSWEATMPERNGYAPSRQRFVYEVLANENMPDQTALGCTVGHYHIHWFTNENMITYLSGIGYDVSNIPLDTYTVSDPRNRRYINWKQRYVKEVLLTNSRIALEKLPGA